MVAVAVLSLLLYLVFNAVTKRETTATRVSFSALSILLIANVLVILASSLLRLLMYEDAYGFSEQRTYTHVFIFWLAGLLVAAIVLELLHKRGFFGLALMLTIVGYVATLGLMNVDGFITNQNVARTMHGDDIDVGYLSSLSTDAVPAMVHTYLDTQQPKPVCEALGAELACRTNTMQTASPRPWQDFRFGESLAETLLQQNKSAWSQYVPVMATDGSGLQVVVGSKTYPCSYYYDPMG